MNYNELTDFEINKLVAEKLGLNVLSIEPYCREDEDVDGNRFFELHGSGSTVQVLHSDERWLQSYRYFDYCNNPSDAWPIILENRIEIHPRDIRVSRNEYIKGWGALPESCSESYEIFSKDKNPLRAAMIVYLMMGEE